MKTERLKISATFCPGGEEIVTVESTEFAPQEFTFPPGGANKFIAMVAVAMEAKYQAQGFQNPNLKQTD